MTARPPGARPRALVLRALGLGDLLTAVPAVRALRRHLPTHELVMATPRRFGPLLLTTALADRVVDTAGLATLPAFLDGAEMAVNLHGKGPQSHQLLLATRPQRLIGFACDGFTFGPRWHAGEHEVDRWCRLVTDAGFPADPDELSLPLPDRRKHSVAVGAIALHPGAAAGARRWPIERWAAVAREVTTAGHRVVITGGPDEQALGHDLVRRAGLATACVLAGRTDILDLFAVVKSARCVVCGDTGVAHVSTAVGTPSVLLFGPTAPQEWGPPAIRRHVVLWRGEPGDPHGTTPSRGLLAISVDDVLSALAQLLHPSLEAHRSASASPPGAD